MLPFEVLHGIAPLGLIDVYNSVIPCFDHLDQLQRFREVVKGIDENEGGRALR